MQLPQMTEDVENAYSAFPQPARERLLELRALIFETAASLDGVGPIEECLKWGEPAYVTAQSKSGTTLRLGWKGAEPDKFAIYFHCQTTLAATFREWFGDTVEIDGSRAIKFSLDEPLPRSVAVRVIEAGLNYHRR